MSNTETKPRTEWIDVAKGGAIILVVLIHAIQFLDPLDIVAPVYQKISNITALIRMPLFFMLSGFLATRAIQRQWKDVLTKKTLFYLYILLLWTTINWIYKTALIDDPSLRENLLLYIYNHVITPSTHIWYIQVLAVYFPLTKLVRNFNKPLLLTIAFVTSFLISEGSITVESWTYQRTMIFYPYFLLGVFYGKEILEFITNKTNLVAIVSFAVYGALYFHIYSIEDPFTLTALRTILTISGTVVGLVTSIYIANHTTLFKNVMSHIGKNTLPIYLFHMVFIDMLGYVIKITAIEFPHGALYMTPTTIAAAIASSLLCKKLSDKYNTKWLYALPSLPQRTPIEVKTPTQ